MRNWQLSQPAAQRRHVAAAVDGRAKIEPCGSDSEAAHYYFSHHDEKHLVKLQTFSDTFPSQQNLKQKKRKEVVVVVVVGGAQKIQSFRWITRESCVNPCVVVRLWELISWFGIMTFGFAEETAFVIAKNL